MERKSQKHPMNVCGVYKITNPIGLCYIGSSKSVSRRLVAEYYKEPRKLRCIHYSLLQYGIDKHNFEIIEECNFSILRERERFWQEELNTLYPNGLNRNLVSCAGKKQHSSNATSEQISKSKMGTRAWNKGLPTWQSTKDTIKARYSPLTRSASKIILDTRTGVYYYCLREASLAFGIPKQTLKMNLSAPNKDCRKNKTHLIYT